MKRNFEIGDVVRFTDIFYKDPSLYMPCFQADDDMMKILDPMDYNDIGKALYLVEATVTGFWDEGVWLEYKLLGRIQESNHFDFEVEYTGDHRPYNDPSRYDRTLFDLIAE